MKKVARITFIFLYILLFACSGESVEERRIWPNSGGFQEADVFDDAEEAGEQGVAAQIEFPQENLLLELDQTFRPQAIIRDAQGEVLENYPVNWTSRHESILKISSGGVAVAVGLGETTLLAEAGDIRATLSVEVVGAKVASLRIYPQNRELRIGESVQYIVEARSETNAVIEGVALGGLSWAVADESIARIDEFGIARGLGEGQTKIIATVDGVQAEATLSVIKAPIWEIFIDPSFLPTLYPGDRSQLQARAYDEQGRELFGRQEEILWETSDEQIVTVDDIGELLARAPGMATITARAGGASDAVEVDVAFGIQRVETGTGDDFGCAVAIGKVFCWDRIRVQEIAEDFARDISLAESKGCFVAEDGKVFCFEKGVWTLQEQSSLADIRTISVGEGHACALDMDGKAYCWGDNSSGQLGRSGASSVTPVEVNSNAKFVSITVGDRHTCAADEGGDAWCWGANDRSQLGGFPGSRTATPFRVEGGYSFLTLSAGDDFTCGVHPAGPSLCWGAGDLGQLGNGMMVDRDVPTMVSGPVSLNMIRARANQACGLDASGLVHCWGNQQSTPYRAFSVLYLFMEIDPGPERVCGRTPQHHILCFTPRFSGTDPDFYNTQEIHLLN